MSNIDTINVGGLDYSIEDSTARETAEGAVTVSAYVENGNTASRAYSVLGTPINWKGSLYYTKATIAQGATLSSSNLTAAANLGAMMRNIKTYVGTDSKLHFTDATGADSVLPFSGAKELKQISSGTVSLPSMGSTATRTYSLGANKYAYAVFGLSSVGHSVSAQHSDGTLTNARVTIGTQSFNSTTGALSVSVTNTYGDLHDMQSLSGTASYIIWGVDK